MKKRFIVPVIMIFCAAVFTACGSLPDGGHTSGVRKPLFSALESENYYIKDTFTIGGQTGVSEYANVGGLKYCRTVYVDGTSVRYMKLSDRYLIIDDENQTVTAYNLDKTDEAVFDGEYNFLKAVFENSVTGGKYIGSERSDDGSVTEQYRDADGSSVWKFSFTADDKLYRIDSLDKDGTVMATYELEYDENYKNVELFGGYNGYDLYDKRK